MSAPIYSVADFCISGGIKTANLRVRFAWGLSVVVFLNTSIFVIVNRKGFPFQLTRTQYYPGMPKTGLLNRVGILILFTMIRLFYTSLFAVCLSFTASAADAVVPAEEVASPCVAYAIGYADGANDVHFNI